MSFLCVCVFKNDTIMEDSFNVLYNESGSLLEYFVVNDQKFVYNTVVTLMTFIVTGGQRRRWRSRSDGVLSWLGHG